MRIGAVVAVDRLVVVADAEHAAIGTGQQPNEQQVGGREVLELVDEQHAAGALGREAGPWLAEQDLDRPHDLLVEVERPLPLSSSRYRGNIAANPSTSPS